MIYQPITLFPKPPVRLTELPVGASGRVCAITGEANLCARLREIGFCEPTVIQRLSGHHTLLCQISNTRVALSSHAAEHIFVELIDDDV
jgi:ferrous iron transport protein A